MKNAILIIILLTAFQDFLFTQTVHWKIFNTQNSTIPTDYLYCLGLDKDENLWLANHGLWKWDKQNSTTLLQYPDLGSDIVRLTGDSSGNIWVSSESSSLIKTDAINWMTFNFSGSIWTTHIDKYNNLWAGSGRLPSNINGLLKFDGTNWTVFDTSNSGLRYQNILKVTSDYNGTIWGLAISGNSPDIDLFSFNGTIWNHVSAPYSPHWISTISGDKNGNIWYATAYPVEGLVQYDGSNFIFHPKPDSTLYFPTTLATDTSGNLWVCWENGLAEYTDSNWNVFKDSINYDFSDMAIDKYNNIWLSTYGDGVILFNKNGIVLSNDDTNSESILNDFYLSQNYPNPFNPSTKISWQSPVSGHQSLKVYDVLGNKVATLVDEYRNAGSFEIDFNASELSSGVYFYKLQAGSFIQTKKMILIK